MSIYTNIHAKYGSPEKVVEFRLFLLNDCYKSCESCFYKRSGNKIDDFDSIYKLILDLKSKKYELESCYLLPTDFFENPENLNLIKRAEVKKILNEFEYIGIAATMEGIIDFSPFATYMQGLKAKEVELQINLVLERMFDQKYLQEVQNNIDNIKQALEGKVVINLAVNLGLELNAEQIKHIRYLIEIFSDDGIIEVNFTFLYNEALSKELKSKKLIESFKTMKKLGALYNSSERRYNSRTLLKKPAFFFMHDRVYTSAIMPFDEYIFSKEAKYQLKESSFDGFLEIVAGLELYNKPIDNNCLTCENLEYCYGKGYFVAANEFDLPCFLGV